MPAILPFLAIRRRQGATSQISGCSAGCQGASAQISPSGPISRPGQIQLHSQQCRQPRVSALSSLFGHAQPISHGRPARRTSAPSNSRCSGRGHIQPTRLFDQIAPTGRRLCSRGSGHSHINALASRLRRVPWPPRPFWIAVTLMGTSPHDRCGPACASFRRSLAVLRLKYTPALPLDGHCHRQSSQRAVPKPLMRSSGRSSKRAGIPIQAHTLRHRSARDPGPGREVGSPSSVFPFRDSYTRSGPHDAIRVQASPSPSWPRVDDRLGTPRDKVLEQREEMRMRRVGLAALVFQLALASPAAARDCDRTCTLQVSDAVLSALQTGQFGKLLPRSVRVTENGRDIRPADSQLRAFKRITGQHAIAEPAGGVARFSGAAEAYGGPAVFSMRLKLKGDQVAEIETLVVRRTEALTFSPETMSAKPGWDQVLPPQGRASRADLIAISGAWLDRLAQTQTTEAASCSLVENSARPTSCGNVSGLRGATLIRDRRWPLVDEARGLVWVFAMADIPAEAAPARPVSHSARQAAHSVRIGALFRVEAGRIGTIDLVLRDAPLGALTGWAPPKAKKSPSPKQPSDVTDRQ